MAKARGRVTLPEERQDTRRSMLMWHYERNLGFWKDYLWLLYRCERLIEALVNPLDGRPRHDWVGLYADEDKAWQALDAAIDGGPVATNVSGKRRVSTGGRQYMVPESRNTHLRRYRQELMDLCDKWGLRCQWAPPWIHASLVESVQQVVSAEELTAKFDQLPPGVQAAILNVAPRDTWSPARQLWCRFRRWVQGEAAEDELRGAPTLLPGRYPIEGWRPVDERFFEAHRARLNHVKSFGTWTGEPHIRIDTEIHIDVPYDPWPVDEWKDVEKRIIAEAKKRIVAEARQQRDEIRAQYVQAGFRLQDTEPRLERNVRWLYERIALGMNPVAKMQALARGQGQHEDLRDYKESGDGFEFTYRDATSKLAGELGIRLR
jgi:hypothetical protein